MTRENLKKIRDIQRMKWSITQNYEEKLRK